jgi:Secretion system C-terminal sorting domain
VTVDNVLVWSNDGPDNMALYWVGAPDPVVGTVMDGNCSGLSILDYAYFFIPAQPLPVEFATFEVNAVDADAQLDWEMGTASTQIGYDIERSQDGLSFTKVGHVHADDATAYAYRDIAPGNGLFYYRVRAVSAEGGSLASEIQTVTLAGRSAPSLRVWPNPVSRSEDVHIALANVPENAQVQLFDQKGMSIWGGGIAILDIREVGCKVNASTLTPGIYLLTVTFDGQRLQQKIIVQ